MATTRNKQKKTTFKASHLWVMSVELQSLAYLIGMQRLDEIPRPDIEEIHWGVGKLLEKIAKRMRRFSHEIELQESNFNNYRK